MQLHTTIAVADTGAYLAAVACAERRALHSYFDQHVLEEDDGSYVAIDEGDYGTLTMKVIDRIVYTAAGAMDEDH